MITDEEVERALQYLVESAGPAAKARAEKVYLEEFTKHLRSALFQKAPQSLPVAGKEAYSLAHPDYLAHLEGLREAVENDSRYQFMRKAAEAKIEAYRTFSANTRKV